MIGPPSVAHQASRPRAANGRPQGICSFRSTPRTSARARSGRDDLPDEQVLSLARPFERASHLGAQRGQRLLLEPGVALEPGAVARRRVRQRKVARQVVAKAAHRRGQGRRAARAQMMALGVAAEQHDEADLGQEREQTALPERCALGARRQIAAAAPAGIAQALRQDGDARGVVEGRAIQARARGAACRRCDRRRARRSGARCGRAPGSRSGGARRSRSAGSAAARAAARRAPSCRRALRPERRRDRSEGVVLQPRHQLVARLDLVLGAGDFSQLEYRWKSLTGKGSLRYRL